MKLAIPVLNGKLFPHFGKCSEVAFIEVDTTAKTIISTRILAAPRHEHGKLPAWLKSHAVDLLITGGIGAPAKELCANNAIQVLTGAPAKPIEELVQDWLQGHLESSSNACNHDAKEHHEGGDHHGGHEAHSCGCRHD